MKSAQLILNSMGIRASTVGQLGGGVSVCLRSLVDFDWGQDWEKFCETVGIALWGRYALLLIACCCTRQQSLCSNTFFVCSKCFEVMPNLEELIRKKKVGGTWPEASDNWVSKSNITYNHTFLNIESFSSM